MLHRRSLSDRNSSPASIRSYCSSLSAGGTQKYDGAAKLDFSFMSSGEDEGIPEELFEVCWIDEQNLLTRSLNKFIGNLGGWRSFTHVDHSQPVDGYTSEWESNETVQPRWQ